MRVYHSDERDFVELVNCNSKEYNNYSSNTSIKRVHFKNGAFNLSLIIVYYCDFSRKLVISFLFYVLEERDLASWNVMLDKGISSRFDIKFLTFDAKSCASFCSSALG